MQFRETVTISALSSGNVSKYEFLTSKDVLTKKDQLRKAFILTRFEYSPLGKAFEKHTNVIKNRLRLSTRKKTKEIN